jgi:uncharacterized surface protein with fasciclin (FAS1) repeats
MKLITIKTLTLILASISLTALASGAHHGDSHKQKNIVEVAASAGVFNTLVAAVTAADLASTLQGEGPFTVFAPTDEAFSKLPTGTVESLLQPENKDKLIAILTYHVVSGKMMAADVKAGKVPTLNGNPFTVSFKDGNVFVDNAKVTKTDVKASNGVVHIIDSVILPQS